MLQKYQLYLTALSIGFIYFGFFHSSLSAQVPEQDSLALVALYDSTNGDQWQVRTNWKTDQPVATWYGVRVDNGRVTDVELIDNNLVGTIPPEIGNLTALDTLHLYWNHLSGEIPPEIGNLTNLEFIRLTENDLSGPVPSQMSNLTNLHTLAISSNNLSGPIPMWIFDLTGLQHLWLQWNNFTGEIPHEIGNLTNLTRLSLHSNQLTGTYPAELCDLVNLTELYLGYNQLTGEIPAGFGNLVNLYRLWLRGESLSGPFPPVTNMTNLWQLWIYDNQFSGAVPAEICNLQQLVALDISDNEFTDLPDLSPMTSLNWLRICGNRFTFEDIERNIHRPNFTYYPQDSIGSETDTTVQAGDTLILYVSVDGSANQYQWMKDGTDIPGATDSVYVLTPMGSVDAGDYVCRITNSIAWRLSLFSHPVHVSVIGGLAVGEDPSLPTAFALYQNHPNPFNPVTTIRYTIAVRDIVSLQVYDLQGRMVKTLVKEPQPPGSYQVLFDASNYPSGIYFYRLRTPEYTNIKKMLLLK